MNIQWYPGHMTKAKRAMQEDLKLIDLIIEIVDARIPYSSRNPDIDELGKNKARLILLNKSDLASETWNDAWAKWFLGQGFHVIKVNSKSGAGLKQINGVVQEACKEKIERDRKRGILNRPVRAMVVGIPNVGKSTFINSFAGKACTKTGNKPGVTKGNQWIRLNKTLELLDTPGILWPRFENQEVGKKLAFIGSINDEILNKEDLALELLKLMMKQYPEVLRERYGIGNGEEAAKEQPEGAEEQPDRTEEQILVKGLEQIAKSRLCLLKGNEYDYKRAANLFIDDYRSGRLGRITLEFPKEKEELAEAAEEDRKGSSSGGKEQGGLRSRS